jgi:hypothetical protein
MKGRAECDLDVVGLADLVVGGGGADAEHVVVLRLRLRLLGHRHGSLASLRFEQAEEAATEHGGKERAAR